MDSDEQPLVQFLTPDGLFCPTESAMDFLPHAESLEIEDLQRFYRDIFMVRQIDCEAELLQRRGEMALWPPTRGQEAAQVGATYACDENDMIFPSYRDHAVLYVRGIDLVDVARLFRGAGNNTWDIKRHKVWGYTLCIGAQVPHATGYAMGLVLEQQAINHDAGRREHKAHQNVIQNAFAGHDNTTPAVHGLESDSSQFLPRATNKSPGESTNTPHLSTCLTPTPNVSRETLGDMPQQGKAPDHAQTHFDVPPPGRNSGPKVTPGNSCTEPLNTPIHDILDANRLNLDASYDYTLKPDSPRCSPVYPSVQTQDKSTGYTPVTLGSREFTEHTSTERAFIEQDVVHTAHFTRTACSADVASTNPANITPLDETCTDLVSIEPTADDTLGDQIPQHPAPTECNSKATNSHYPTKQNTPKPPPNTQQPTNFDSTDSSTCNSSKTHPSTPSQQPPGQTSPNPIRNDFTQSLSPSYPTKDSDQSKIEYPEAVIVWFGDGASSQGDVSESMVFAARHRTPQVFMLQNNQYAISVPASVPAAASPLYRRGLGFGIPGVRVDGNDVIASYAVVREYMQRARAGAGPHLIEAFTYRLGAHTTSDDPTKYRDEGEHAAWQTLDPLIRLERYLLYLGVQQEWFDHVRTDAELCVKSFRSAVLSISSPGAEEIFDNVYATPHTLLAAQRERALN